MSAKLVKVEFFLPVEWEGDRDYLTREHVAKALQDWYDEDGGLGGNFQVTSVADLNDEEEERWWKEVWNK